MCDMCYDIKGLFPSSQVQSERKECIPVSYTHLAYLDKYTGSMVCSKQLYKEALNHAFDEPKQWEIREINEIKMCIRDRWECTRK